MKCDIHCPPEGGSLGRVVAVAVALAAAAPVVLAVAAGVAAVIPAVTVTILAACAAGAVVVARLVVYGRRMRPAMVKAQAQNLNKALPDARKLELPSGARLAIEAPKVVPGEVLAGGARDRLPL